jgi:hypothetical protein
MGAQTDMVQAVTDAEAAAVALTTAWSTYLTAYKSAAAAVRAAGGERGLQDVAELEHSVGPERFAHIVGGRLVALGGARVVAQAMTPAGPEFMTWLIGQIQSHVPAAAGTSAGV